MTTIGAIAATAVEGSRSQGAIAAKEVVLEKEIASKSAQCESTDCKDTAAKLTKEVENLKAALGSLKAQETKGSAAAADAQQKATTNAGQGVQAASGMAAPPFDETQQDYRSIPARASAAVHLALSNLERVDGAPPLFEQ
jgi:hypothetical protein